MTTSARTTHTARRPATRPPAGSLWSAATAAADRGWPVFPLVPGSKRPAVRDWERRATCDPDRVARCWAAGPYGVAIACGPAGLVVVDLDRPKPDTGPPPDPWAGVPGVTDGRDVLAVLAERAGADYPTDTYTVRTPTGGQHLYFTRPAGAELRNTAGGLGWLIDTRAAGGYVVAAGVRHPGGRYAVLDDADAAELPAWIGALLTADAEPATAGDRPAPAAPVVTDARRAGYLAAAVRGEVARVRDARAGARNAALYMAAQVLGQLAAGGHLDADAVREQLLTAAADHIAADAASGAQNPFTRREAAATITSGLRAGARRPRTLTTGPGGDGRSSGAAA